MSVATRGAVLQRRYSMPKNATAIPITTRTAASIDCSCGSFSGDGYRRLKSLGEIEPKSGFSVPIVFVTLDQSLTRAGIAKGLHQNVSPVQGRKRRDLHHRNGV